MEGGLERENGFGYVYRQGEVLQDCWESKRDGDGFCLLLLCDSSTRSPLYYICENSPPSHTYITNYLELQLVQAESERNVNMQN